ncbi:MAG: hypothetical protein K8T89_26555, partial [Planctomycetes bacterium]|nr:hypothetical protein [Planctomycetota bacterium]
WQNHSRLIAPQAAQWACDLAAVEIQKVRKVHEQLVNLAPPVPRADEYLKQAEERLSLAKSHEQSRDYPAAHQEALRALRPLRILMRFHWEQAVRTLDMPTASPYAVSFFTLPSHWELHKELRGTSAGANSLKDGDFEAVAKRPEFSTVSLSEKKEKKSSGVPITTLPGWTLQQQTIDAVELEAKLVPSSIAFVEKPKKPERKKARYDPSNGDIQDAPEPPEPTLGDSVLKLEIRPKIVTNPKDGKPQPAPAALERTYLAVNTPAVRLPPGTWVRVSGLVRVPAAIQASADGLLVFDSVCGEGMGVRLTDAKAWHKIHLYRKVPPSGTIWVTAALTGIGTVYIDDLKIEPLVK